MAKYLHFWQIYFTSFRASAHFKNIPQSFALTSTHQTVARIACANPRNDKKDLAHLRESIHYFGFVVEELYTENEHATKIEWFKNPSLITNDTPGLDLKNILKGNGTK